MSEALDNLQQVNKGITVKNEQVTRPVTVIDTSVLMSDPEGLNSFAEHDIVIPLTVVDELDANKHRDDAPGRNARETLRTLEKLRGSNNGDIASPVSLPNGSTVRVELNGVSSKILEQAHLDAHQPDHRIIAAALTLAEAGSTVNLVSNDASMRIKASVLGLSAAEHYQPPTRPIGPGWTDLEVTRDSVDMVHSHGRGDITLADFAPEDREAISMLDPNTFVVLHAGQSSALARVIAGEGVRALPRGDRAQIESWGLRARSKEQAFSLDLLSDREVPLVALQGRAGTGKTILAIAAGLQQVFEEGRYGRLTILRPVISVGRQDLGFLPGELEDKLGPWFETVVDTMVALSTTGQTHRECSAQLDVWVDEGRLTLEAVTFMRGRSLQNTYLLVDEVQNLETSVVKTLVTRLGEDSKGVFIGDVTQVDNPWTSPTANGLNSLIGAFAGEPEFGHVTLTKGERSRISYLAGERM